MSDEGPDQIGPNGPNGRLSWWEVSHTRCEGRESTSDSNTGLDHLPPAVTPHSLARRRRKLHEHSHLRRVPNDRPPISRSPRAPSRFHRRCKTRGLQRCDALRRPLDLSSQPPKLERCVPARNSGGPTAPNPPRAGSCPFSNRPGRIAREQIRHREELAIVNTTDRTALA